MFVIAALSGHHAGQPLNVYVDKAYQSWFCYSLIALLDTIKAIAPY